MVKIFIGNLSSTATAEELRILFEKYGNVSECDIVKNYGFVHMPNTFEAEQAIQNLNQHEMHGWPMNVEISKGRPKATTKLHVSNLGEGVTSNVLRGKFEEFGPVVECDIVKDYAFVHMERMEDAMDAIEKMDNTAFKGKLMSVKLSTSRLRTAPGMADHTGCYVCGKFGHWSKDCHNNNSSARGRSGPGAMAGPSTCDRGSYGMASLPEAEYAAAGGGGGGAAAYSGVGYAGGMLPPAPGMGGYSSEQADRYGRAAAAAAAYYPDRSRAYERDNVYSSVDYYQKYRVWPYASGYGFKERPMSYIPQMPPASSSLAKIPTSADPYDRQPPLPPSAAAAYCAQDSSAIRRVPVSSASYAYDQTGVSAASVPRSSYSAASRPKDPYSSRYAPY